MTTINPAGKEGVKVDRYLAWPIDSEYAEICMYWYDEERWSRGCDDTIKVTAWMPLPERSEAATQQSRIADLETAIIKTLNENRHLADGDVCTLIDLKRAMPGWE